ncbi:DUF1330 domain-containing protein [Catenuloplanes japonicus]|uniref:DUF1330 domain-containing protein n=1 Tax=Catenuloplanes japonicus TaxID=33876 RepID=UPI0005240BF3|nr:DUF1330 domain-containing protein [Catenuloplanes japonicus]
MTAYVIIDLKVTDPQGFSQYAREAAELLTQYGGRNLMVDMKPVALEGSWQPSGLVIQEFPDAGMVNQWYESPEYQRLKDLRERYSETAMMVVAEAQAMGT